ncbi:RnfABCDGE type electron transport complex subunit D [Clostridium formicaceticum]|uniref:Ion-translocating oxidoreductase complex subunit D n=1 Tax=Clostridium formicaceticum TaxID=1497 RepID=A0AAC9RN55_9CLOT|nr:RnfABCDGE type electron transport complex subunit D [Clostridium formicaceticum]AOY76843.1 Na+-transporting NADH:ubiquinone oxidoreductase subunit D [Clostridium formicaceticum]ARE87320.1 Electron transport complex protein RnfD [Clostridium formicaceticum]
MDEKLIVSSSPHILDDDTAQRIMLDVVIALLPATIAAIYYFRANAAILVLLSVLTAVVTEAGVQKWLGRPVTINDFSAVVTGLLLALNIPASAPWWMPVVGSFFAIAIVKQVFGGVGHNFMNPALAGRIFLTLSWTDRMTAWITPGVDAVSTATPLAIIKEAGGTLPNNLPSLFNTIIGNTGGSMGETSALLLLLGGVYLIYKGVISWKIPGIYIGTVGVLTLVFGGFDATYMLYHVFSGGLMLGAIYMATDYASSPVTPRGRIIFAFGCGLLTSLIRLYGAYPEGVAFSILLMNVASPLIDRYTSPRVFGEVK